MFTSAGEAAKLSVMSSFKYRQDMPPSGGYSGINWARKIAKPGMSGWLEIGIVIFFWLPLSRSLWINTMLFLRTIHKTDLSRFLVWAYYIFRYLGIVMWENF